MQWFGETSRVLSVNAVLQGQRQSAECQRCLAGERGLRDCGAGAEGLWRRGATLRQAARGAALPPGAADAQTQPHQGQEKGR